jgi:hypothetical protein
VIAAHDESESAIRMSLIWYPGWLPLALAVIDARSCPVGGRLPDCCTVVVLVVDDVEVLEVVVDGVVVVVVEVDVDVDVDVEDEVDDDEVVVDGLCPECRVARRTPMRMARTATRPATTKAIIRRGSG